MTEKKLNPRNAAADLLKQFGSQVNAENFSEWLTKLTGQGIDNAEAMSLIEYHNYRLSHDAQVLPQAPENPDIKIITDSRGHVGSTGPKNPAGRESNEG